MEIIRTPHSLYVGDLDATVTEDQFFHTFSGINGFVSAVLCKDEDSGISLRYGYLNFFDHQSALEVIATRNNTLINGKAITIMWQRDRRNENANLFVKNLESSIDSMKLQAIFEKYGSIVSCKIQVCENGNSKGYGYVQFETIESAEKAIEDLNGQKIEGKKICVDRFKRKEERFQSEIGYTNLYVKNLEQNVTEEILQEKFSRFGNINSLFISRDCDGISKGFGFVNFEKSEDAKKAKQLMDGTLLGSKLLYVARAQKKLERELQLQETRRIGIQQYKGMNVYVKYINDDVDDAQLKKHFEQCGRVNSVKIMTDKKGISRGFGFVCFSQPQAAQRAITILHGVMFHGKPLYVSMAQSKEERRELLQITHRERMTRGLQQPWNTSVTPKTSYYPSSPTNSGFKIPNWGRMNEHAIAQNLNHPTLFPYQQRAIYHQNVLKGQRFLLSSAVFSTSLSF